MGSRASWGLGNANSPVFRCLGATLRLGKDALALAQGVEQFPIRADEVGGVACRQTGVTPRMQARGCAGSDDCDDAGFSRHVRHSDAIQLARRFDVHAADHE